MLWMFRRWKRISWSLTTIQTWCARCDLFESSHGEVLCDATNKPSVSDMLCRDSKKICKQCKEQITVLRTRGAPRRKKSQGIFLQWSIVCLISSGAHRGHRAFLATRLGLDLSCFILNSVGYGFQWMHSLLVSHIGQGRHSLPWAEQ
jgi:hypothetical protein